MKYLIKEETWFIAGGGEVDSGGIKIYLESEKPSVEERKYYYHRGGDVICTFEDWDEGHCNYAEDSDGYNVNMYSYEVKEVSDYKANDIAMTLMEYNKLLNK